MWSAMTVLILMLAGVVGMGTPALADMNCYYGPRGHCYSNAIYNGSGLTGLWGYLPRNNTTINTGLSADAHISNEIWLNMDGDGYLEAGTVNWNDSHAYDGGCGCQAYDLVWADTTPGGRQAQQWQHVIQHVTPNGAKDSFEFDHASGYDWNVYLNGSQVGHSTVTGGSSGNEMDMGGEYASVSCQPAYGSADNFDDWAEVRDSGGNWFYPPIHTYIDSNCGFDGISYGDGEWSWNKHTP